MGDVILIDGDKIVSWGTGLKLQEIQRSVLPRLLRDKNNDLPRTKTDTTAISSKTPAIDATRNSTRTSDQSEVSLKKRSNTTRGGSRERKLFVGDYHYSGRSGI